MYYKDLKTLFVHIPKNAGTSVTKMLDSCSEYPVSSSGIAQFGNDTGAGKIYHRKLSQYYYENSISNQLYDLTTEELSTFFKFAVVREPLDRLGSLYRYLIRSNRIEKDTTVNKFFLNWIPKTLDNPEAYLHYFVAPQYDFVSINGEIAVDKVFYYENLDEELGYLKSKIGFVGSLGHLNSTKLGKYVDVSSTTLIKKVVDKYYENDYKFFYPDK